MSIKIVDSEILDSALEDVADAIRAKVGTSEQLEFPDEFVSAIENIPSGGAVADDVRFIDYDGEIVATYSKAAFLALTEMPANPSHTGLTAQGWNWSLADAKTYVTTNDFLDIGQMYITDDGKTRLYITIDSTVINQIQLSFSETNASGVEIDWGDNSEKTVPAGSGNLAINHIYENTGSYVITIKPLVGNYAFNNGVLVNSVNSSAKTYFGTTLNKVELGSNVTNLTSCFTNNYNLSSITIPNNVTVMNGTFGGGTKLVHATVPNSVTSLGDNAFDACWLLKTVSLPNLTGIGNYAFRATYTLKRISIPNSIVTLNASTFENCSSLTSIILPANLTEIKGSCFKEDHSLKSVKFSHDVILRDAVFAGCNSLDTVIGAQHITSVAYNTFYTSGLKGDFEFTLNSNDNQTFMFCRYITSLKIIGNFTTFYAGAIASMTSLRKLELDGTITSIQGGSLNNSSLLEIIYPPNLSTVTNMTNIPVLVYHNFSKLTSIPSLTGITLNSFSKIVVPDELYDDWIVETGWSTYASRTIKASELNNL